VDQNRWGVDDDEVIALAQRLDNRGHAAGAERAAGARRWTTNWQQVEVVQEAAAEGELERLVAQDAVDKARRRVDAKVVGHSGRLDVRFDQTHAALRVVLSDSDSQTQTDGGLAFAGDGAADRQDL